MSDRVERPSLSIKRASRRDATAPYLSRRDSGANSSGLTNELKEKANVLDFDESTELAESSRQDSVASSSSAGQLGSSSGSISKKSDSGKKGMKSRMALMIPKRKEKDPEMVQCTVVRSESDGFGLWLNRHNRITAVSAGSSAEAEGVRVFDRVMKLDGTELRCKLEDAIGSRSSLALTLERPPLSAHRPIVAQESQPNSEPYEFSSRPKSKSRGDSEPEPPKPAGKEHAGKQQITAKLERDAGADSFGIEISPMNTITAVTLGGSGEKAGLMRGDQVIKLNGRKCTTAVTEMPDIKKTSLELVVVRGAELSRKMSITPIAVSADL